MKLRKELTRWLEIGSYGVGMFGVGLAIYLSVKSSPSMSAVHWLPHFITAWADRHGQLCNFPAYALLACPFLICAPRWWHRACVTIVLSVLVVGLEITQLWIPTRVCDKWDMFWGCSGLLASWIVMELLRLLVAKIPALKQDKP